MLGEFEKLFPQLVTVKGTVRDFLFRVLHVQHSIWWDEDPSPYKVNLWHNSVPEGLVSPDYYLERVIDLCGYEITNKYYGLNLYELMQLDLSTFEMIEKAVHKEAERQARSMSKLPKEFGLDTKGK